MLTPIQIPPGIERHGTAYETPNRYYDSNLVRWQSGNMHPVGGWTKLTATPLSGAIRKFHVYRDNSNQRHSLVGTDTKLYTDNGSYLNITPGSFVPLTSIGSGGGYGTGPYGANTWGTARPSPSPAFSPFAYWTFDNWGEDVILTANSDGRLFYYDTSAVTTPTVITTAPTGNNAVLVTEERHVMAFGQTGGGGSVKRVAWASRGDYTDWNFSSVTNTAGFEDLDAASPLLKGIHVAEGILVMSLADVFLARYVGQPFIYGFNRIGSCALMHPDGIIPFGGKAAWMSLDGFQLYSGGTVVPLECPIFHDIKDDLDPTWGRFRFHGSLNAVFPELWWFYATTGNTEANRYVIWNYHENWWARGTLLRSAMSSAENYIHPYMGDSLGNVYEHEVGYTNAGMSRFQDVFVETGALPIGDGLIVDVNQMHIATINQHVSVTAYSQLTPDGPERTFGPYTPRANGYTDTRINGRNVRLRFQPTADVHWGIGMYRLDIPQQGKGGARR